MIAIRLIKPDEIEAARQMVKEQLPWAAEPSWASTYVRLEDGVLTGLIETQSRVVVGTLAAASPRATHELIAWVDGGLTASGVKQYEFNVPDCNPQFQQLVERHFGLEGERELPGKIYFVKKDS